MLHELAHAATARAFRLPCTGSRWCSGAATRRPIRASEARSPRSSSRPPGPFTHAGPGGRLLVGCGGLPTASCRRSSGNLAFLSLLFAGLNALPGFPVDGGRMLLAVVWGVTKDRYLALRVAGWGGVVVGAVLGVIAAPAAPSGGRRLALLRVHRLDDDRPGTPGGQAVTNPARSVPRQGLRRRWDRLRRRSPRTPHCCTPSRRTSGPIVRRSSRSWTGSGA